ASDSLDSASESSDSASETSDLASEALDFLDSISEVNSLVKKCAIVEANESNIHEKNERKELSYINSLKKKRREKRMPETLVSQDPTKIFEMYSQPVNRYFNEASISSLEPELLPMLIEDVNSCAAYLRIWDSYYDYCIREIGN
ncbi:11120_t:CDS:2, partial [Racocetra persica]